MCRGASVASGLGLLPPWPHAPTTTTLERVGRVLRDRDAPVAGPATRDQVTQRDDLGLRDLEGVTLFPNPVGAESPARLHLAVVRTGIRVIGTSQVGRGRPRVVGLLTVVDAQRPVGRRSRGSVEQLSKVGLRRRVGGRVVRVGTHAPAAHHGPTELGRAVVHRGADVAAGRTAMLARAVVRVLLVDPMGRGSRVARPVRPMAVAGRRADCALPTAVIARVTSRGGPVGQPARLRRTVASLVPLTGGRVGAAAATMGAESRGLSRLAPRGVRPREARVGRSLAVEGRTGTTGAVVGRLRREALAAACLRPAGLRGGVGRLSRVSFRQADGAGVVWPARARRTWGSANGKAPTTRTGRS